MLQRLIQQQQEQANMKVLIEQQQLAMAFQQEEMQAQCVWIAHQQAFTHASVPVPSSVTIGPPSGTPETMRVDDPSSVREG